ncbi:MAG TPA: hypothetical protein VL856_12225 [Acidimicrobiia bacterium]|jgi:hypothetical protein|nr:hypothetical protein [Acidimicrobiia bacterium]
MSVALAAPVGATNPHGPRAVRISGTWHLLEARYTNIRPEGALFRYDDNGSTLWAGDLTGSSTFSGGGTFDPSTGTTDSELHESFVGRVKGVGRVELHWTNINTDPVLVSGSVPSRSISGTMYSTLTDPGQQDTSHATDVRGVYEGVLYVS